MILSPEGDEISSDEDALAFLFAVHASFDGSEGIFRIPQPHRHRLIDKALHQIIAQFEVELAIPWVRGKFCGAGATIIYLDIPDFSPHTKLYDPNSFGVLEVHTEKSTDDGSIIYAGFDAYVRLGESNTWLCIGIKPPDPLDGKSLLDFDDEDDEIYAESGELLPETPRPSQDDINRAAIVAANMDGFGAVWRSREMRADFVRPIISERLLDFDDEWSVDAVSRQAVTFWEFGVVPRRAKALKSEGEKISAIAKKLGITTQRAERAVSIEMKHTVIKSMEEYEANQ